jgi:four helix bundle protein
MEQPLRDLSERTFEFARRIVNLCRVLDQKPGESQTLANLLLRSRTSIGANVQEGQAGRSRVDFISKYSIACKEVRETHLWLRLPVDIRNYEPVEEGPRPKAKIKSTQQELEEIRNALAKTGWNKSKAARLLGIGRRTIYRKIEDYQLSDE